MLTRMRNLADNIIYWISKQAYPTLFGFFGLFIPASGLPFLGRADGKEMSFYGSTIILFSMGLFGWMMIMRSIPDIRGSNGFQDGFIFWVIHALGWGGICVFWGLELFFIFKRFVL